MKNRSYYKGFSLIGIAITLVAVALIAGGLFLYFGRGIPERVEIPEEVEIKDEIVEEEVLITSKELVGKIVEAYQWLRTYQQDMKIIKTTEGKGGKLESRFSYLEIVDIENQKRRVETVLNNELITLPIDLGPEELEMLKGFMKFMEQELEMYYINGFWYVKMRSPYVAEEEILSEWNKEEKPWRSFLGKWIDLLKVAEIEILGTEKEDGIESYKIEVITEIEEIWNILVLKGEEKEIGKLVLKEMTTSWGIGLVEEAPDVKELSMKQWIAKDTFRPIKTRIEIGGTREVMGTTEIVDVVIVVRYSNFDELIVIELPVEAREALKLE